MWLTGGPEGNRTLHSLLAREKRQPWYMQAHMNRNLHYVRLDFKPISQLVSRVSVYLNYSKSLLSDRRDSNPQHLPWKGNTLPVELLSHKQNTFYIRNTSVRIIKIICCVFFLWGRQDSNLQSIKEKIYSLRGYQLPVTSPKYRCDKIKGLLILQ